VSKLVLYSTICSDLYYVLKLKNGDMTPHTTSTPLVAFQGVHGAYSEEATRQQFGADVVTLPCPLLPDVFSAVERGDATYGIVPVENSVAGTVASAYELLTDNDLRIQAEVVLRVRHVLLAPPGSKIGDIQYARSHPQALSQCEQFLTRRGIKAMPYYDTAGSAQDLAANPQPNTAAIASALAGQLYGLDVLERGIEDHETNFTRMFLIGHGDPPPGLHNKTSLVFATQDQAGALHTCLGEFATRGINLTKIESKPRRGKPWQYNFYVDIDGHFTEPNCEAALMGLLRRAAYLKILGSYPATPSPDDVSPK